MDCTSAAFLQGHYSTLMSYLEVHVHTVQRCTYCTVVLLNTTIPDWSQSRAQKNFFSLNGFSEVGTGVIRGSSQECASQYAIRSAAAFDTWRWRWSDLGPLRNMITLRLYCFHLTQVILWFDWLVFGQRLWCIWRMQEIRVLHRESLDTNNQIIILDTETFILVGFL